MLLLAGFRPARSRWRRLVVRSKTWKEEGVAVAAAAAAVARRRRAIELRRRRAGGGILRVLEGGKRRRKTDDVWCGLGFVGDFFERTFLLDHNIIFVQKLESLGLPCPSLLTNPPLLAYSGRTTTCQLHLSPASRLGRNQTLILSLSLSLEKERK